VPCVYCGDEKKTREKEKKEMSVSNGTLLFEIFRIRKQKRKREEKGKKKKKHVWLFVSWHISSIPSPIYIHS
jgi:hypothetical protein